ncbi:hypothetical protein HPB52_007385 [Rhipicephalus sanguineus]|uniref:Uncharacterized protein n=1 Tax=Rhipicephalus sanguineus TaxID=34632 RepID=A0A9D4QDV0_RHISA|nr:hypothetical protein HPB52_007385 [Rhipicephalus sanguineus]
MTGKAMQSPQKGHGPPESSKRSRSSGNQSSPAVTKGDAPATSPTLADQSSPQARREGERSTHHEPAMLINVRSVWADEAAAGAAAGGTSLGDEVGAPRSSAIQQEAPSSDSWRPPHMISQTAASHKTSTDSRFHCSRRDTFLVSLGFCLGVSGFWRFPALMAEHGASFLLACVVIYAVMAQPVFYLELAMGQFVGSGVTRLNKCFPLLNGKCHQGNSYA